ncbi:hypothetical protein MBAV_003384 [Candidatus Magnetobacterium bavaricum]|uniref:Uncharacterized protein n=1 Tax=Candidatus Magnetobacterium bavaricum TaxID=29290 RepID=A0A0F3GR47_9BACT|nr:hypothetical protein MBAV_003384 [Candidatus Magnetobacterium bavaricum]
MVFTGDTITYSVEVDPPKDVELQFPAYTTGSDNLTIVDESIHQSGFFKKSTIKRYKLRSYTPGIYRLPPATVKYKSRQAKEYTEAKTNEVTVEVKSAQDKTPATDIRDIKDLRGGKVLWPYIIAGAVTLLIAAIALYLIRRRRAIKAPPAIIQRPAHELAYEALERLKASTLLQDGLVKEYFIELSAIVRHYIEDRFLLRAPEMTTEEFLGKMRDARQLSESQKALLGDFLQRCDMVKFARYGPDPEEIQESFNAAMRFVDETRPLPQAASHTKDSQA